VLAKELGYTDAEKKADEKSSPTSGTADGKPTLANTAVEKSTLESAVARSQRRPSTSDTSDIVWHGPTEWLMDTGSAVDLVGTHDIDDSYHELPEDVDVPLNLSAAS
jgi:hypothetical protein